ncbi:flagellar M-ring protein FliF [Allochromatium warmingii]|uniref:Flagellar M-ring protein n=2 Tax=Allochromatium warmingii TaxID=61595 RepID=A0A1H3JMY5_ALLWA|nr:flagellar M-ring protein FliF [Allochromatium warmingii]
MDTAVAETTTSSPTPTPPPPPAVPNTLSGRLALGLQGFRDMPVGRQIALLGILAGGLVAVVAILFWALRPTYVPLFSQLESAEAAEVMEVLTKLGVPYRVDNSSGRIEIPQQRVAETRLQLAGQGLPKAADIGFELLQQDSGFGTSRLMEGARFQRALEGELGRSIAALDSVEKARVHLAKAERSVFVRERVPPSASVVVHLKGNRSLTDTQVKAIVHLVSSSVPELMPERVTVVDHSGRLLTSNDDDNNRRLSLDHLEYTHRVESSYVDRVQALLTPLVGRDRVRVQVSADLDFAQVERTQESYNPDQGAVRSELQRDEERLGADPFVGGIPGALTNQPPAGGVVGQPAVAGQDQKAQMPSTRTQQTTRNYEVDRTISHIQEVPGTVKRLTAAVVVDYVDQVNDAGEPIRQPRSEAEMETLRELVREAIGFNGERGDSLQVRSASFVADAAEDAEPIWTQPWFLELVKIIGGLLLALIVLLAVVRPVMKLLLPKPPEPEPTPEALEKDGELPALTDGSAGEDELGEETLSLSQESTSIASLLSAPKELDRQQQLDLEAIREMVREDPKRVVQVMKQWLGEDSKSANGQ